MEKATLTLYTTTDTPQNIPGIIQKIFAPVIQSVETQEEKTILTLQDESQISFHLSHTHNKPEFIEMHITGMINFFAQAPTPDSALKEKVLQQIRCFNCIVGIVFGTNEQEERTHYLINTLFDLAQEVNGYLLYPNMCIYNGQGKLVFSKKGESEVSEMPTITDDKVLQENTSLKSRKEMVQRAVALFALAVYSEVLLSENPDRDEALSYVEKLDEIYHLRSWLTPDEATYLSNPDSTENERIQFAWRYECCGTLLWAAGITEELPYPSDICDVPVIAGIFWQHQGTDHLLSKGIPRSYKEIEEAARLTHRYAQVCMTAHIHQQKAPADLDTGVVMERQYIFNWIMGNSNENSKE